MEGVMQHEEHAEPTAPTPSAPAVRRQAACWDDQDLLMRIQCQDEGALGRLYDQYGGLVYSIALRMTGDRAVAEEVIQDVFWGVWRSAGGFHLGQSVASWLIGITRHRALDATRSHSFRARSREVTLDALWPTDTAGTSEEQATYCDLRVTIRQALGLLSASERLVVALAYYGGLTSTEIADNLHIPVGTVKTRRRLALQKLHATLGSVREA
jgi:RNA polymerase sigma-70 factor, ECF subfamily